MHDDEKFALLVDALRPHLDRIVIVGGWAHRLFRHHQLAQAVPYQPLMTRDTDVAIPPELRIDDGSLRGRLLAGGFSENVLGDDRPPVTHYRLGDDDAGFYVEFLTPLAGGEFKRDGTRDVTAVVAGVSAQKVRHLDVLLIAPWTVALDLTGTSTRIMIPNPVSYIVQKLLIGARRKPAERAKDVLYVHDTLELFARSLPELHRVWTDTVQPQLGTRTVANVRKAAGRVSEGVTDDAREAARMAAGRGESAENLVEVCRMGLAQLLDERAL